MNSAAIPEPWATRMIERGYTDKRRKDDVASLRSLSEATDLHASTISDIVHGRRRPGTDTIAILVNALGVDVQDWVDAIVELGPYQPPAESALLTKSQRDALTTLIRSIAAEQRKAGGGHADGSASNTGAGATLATQYTSPDGQAWDARTGPPEGEFDPTALGLAARGGQPEAGPPAAGEEPHDPAPDDESQDDADGES